MKKCELISKMCLNNWHYIQHKVLEFNSDINFFTGHSGSGKSTVIDALQLLLYANTDGRSFFNKAASDDSDRSLIEYLRGMTNIDENNKFSYLRNQDFSSTIVIQLDRTDNGESQCIGVVFDVETATNDVSRQFFWHKGELIPSLYRVDNRAMSIDELKKYLRSNFRKEDFFCSGTNERFRKNLYDIYLGGLDADKFPTLFKRAISFRMDIKIEEFVKEFICMEQDIHIEDMQVSVMEYGRMRKRIQDTYDEIQELKRIQDRYDQSVIYQDNEKKYAYFIERLNIKQARENALQLQNKIQQHISDIELKEKAKLQIEDSLKALEHRAEELVKQIAATGVDECKQQLESVSKLLKRLLKSQQKWDDTAKALEGWEELDDTPNQVLWNIEKFRDRTITDEELTKLKESIADIRKSVGRELAEVNGSIRDLEKLEKELRDEMTPLRQGKRSYPKELESAREYIKDRLCQKFERPVEVDILASLLDIEDEEWRNAVEGYLGNQKLALVVEPKYSKAAMEIYQGMDKKKYHKVIVLDTENLEAQDIRPRENALSKEVIVTEKYLRNYIDYVLGNVIECDDIDALREQQTGVTRDCMLYKGFRLQHMNPDNYTRHAYIGETSLRKRMSQLEKSVKELEKKKEPLKLQKISLDRVMNIEALSMENEEYAEWRKDILESKKQEQERERLLARLKEIESKDVEAWEQEHKNVEAQIAEKRAELKRQEQQIWSAKGWVDSSRKNYIQQSEELQRLESEFESDERYDTLMSEEIADYKNISITKLIDEFNNRQTREHEMLESELIRLREEKTGYLRKYPNRPFSTEEKEHARYKKLLDELECDELEKFKKIAGEQARTAVEHFKDDFMYKIRSAIREAVDRQNDLNNIISKLDFGKDKYRFVISKNKGADGRYYDMFMDDSLEVDPSDLGGIEDQINMFTIEHENRYGDMMNELINIFIPPENATTEQLEEAKRNMDKYADYRTYLSFEMQQIIKGDETIHIDLSRMIRKNSGGEGQNPQYVALLASFAQMYRIDLAAKSHRNPTIRLVVLDEAFSKMDAEKVAGCIRLIRGLGFQAIICATNDKIQNYLENVDKTFVFANPDKKCISIQEFERRDFSSLVL